MAWVESFLASRAPLALVTVLVLGWLLRGHYDEWWLGIASTICDIVGTFLTLIIVRNQDRVENAINAKLDELLQKQGGGKTEHLDERSKKEVDEERHHL